MIELLALLYIVLRMWMQMRDSKPNLKKHRYLLVVAHADDESMFFGPFLAKVLKVKKVCQKKRKELLRKITVEEERKNLQISRLGKGPPEKKESKKDSLLVILVCTDGSKGGEKETRNEEMRRLGETLDIPVYFLDEPDGGLKATDCLVERLQRIYVSTERTKIVTFDRGGASGHSDHKECYTLAKKLCQKIGSRSFYTLATYSLLGKYWYGVFDIENKIVFANNLKESIECRLRMGYHKSQLLWFRYLYILFSTYMDVNVLQLKVLH
ncbi:N-acetylglucosaminylphosphatidylinositol deacetylase [Nematocida sp. AWRm77]|nr:N-acetylglucosaminylphosphatidylinositol deacetylase [Nematocida sp. AWRm77]